MNSYYNTNKESGEELIKSERQARTQEERILEFFEEDYDSKNVVELFGPSYIHEAVFDHSIPITSVRRAMTNLTNQGKLIKTDIMVIGQYGKKEHTWKYAHPDPQLNLF